MSPLQALLRAICEQCHDAITIDTVKRAIEIQRDAKKLTGQELHFADQIDGLLERVDTLERYSGGRWIVWETVKAREAQPPPVAQPEAASEEAKRTVAREEAKPGSSEPYPFHCSKCGAALTFDKHECFKPITQGQPADGPLRAPSYKCPKCGNPVFNYWGNWTTCTTCGNQWRMPPYPCLTDEQLAEIRKRLKNGVSAYDDEVTALYEDAVGLLAEIERLRK